MSNKKAKMQRIEQKKETPYLDPRLPLFVIIGAFVVWVYFVLSNYWANYSFAPFAIMEKVFSLNEFPNAVSSQVIDTWINHFVNLVFIAVFWFSAFGWGSLLLNKQEYKLELNLFRIGFGIAVTIAFIFVIGLSGFLYAQPVVVFLIIGLILGINKISKNRNEVPVNFLSKFTFNEKIILISLLYPFFLGLSGALSPETFYDSAVYHLGVPQAWINSHRMHVIPSIHMSFYPCNIEVLYTIGLLLRDEMAAKLIHFSFGLFNFVIVFVMLNKYFNRSVAWLGSVIFWTTPFALLVSSKTAIEMGIGFFEVLAFFAFLNWMNSGSAPSVAGSVNNAALKGPDTSHIESEFSSGGNKEKKWLIISAVFSGLGMGSKYISLYASTALVILLIFFRLYRDKAAYKEVFKEVMIFVGVASVVLSPLLIRNYIWVNNPVFPMLWQQLGDIKMRSLGYLQDPPRRPFTLKNILMLPWTYTMGKNILEPYCGPIYLLLLPFFFLFKRKNKQVDFFIAYSLIYYFIWQYLQAHIRLFLPALTVVSGVFAYWIWYLPSNLLRKTVIWIVVILTFGNVQLTSMLQKYSENPLGAFLGLVSKNEQLSKGKGIGSYVSPNYAAIDWVNNNLPEDSYILFIGETRGIYCKRKFLTHTVSEFVPIVELVKTCKNEDEVYNKLKEQGFTNILINVREVYRLKGYNLYYWNGDEWERFNLFWNKYMKEVFNADWVFVYQLQPYNKDDRTRQIPHNYLAEIYLSKNMKQ
ncbi:MAG: hypothetical protein LHV68_12160 [Elusimicrobia bacterium]|nr:hypothetical protein [Candidatus Liberimonas magnetica]